MSAPVAQQIISVMKILMGEDGTTEGKDFHGCPSVNFSDLVFRTELLTTTSCMIWHIRFSTRCLLAFYVMAQALKENCCVLYWILCVTFIDKKNEECNPGKAPKQVAVGPKGSDAFRGR